LKVEPGVSNKVGVEGAVNFRYTEEQNDVDEATLFAEMTKEEMAIKREETADRALISAVKTIAGLSRAQDL